jgi:hypothetical protein
VIQNPASPTWAHDVAPILYKNCTTCHHAGGAGPFTLLTYADTKRWAPQILNVTQSRFMPPWLPEPGYGDFADVRRLSDSDQALLKRWITAGMAPGDLKAAPPEPHYDANWQAGKPDLVLKVERPFTLPPGGTDVFRNLILPYPLKQTHYIRAMEIKPGAPQVVHHANILVCIPPTGKAACPAWSCLSMPATSSNRTAISSSGSRTPRSWLSRRACHGASTPETI